MADEKSGQLRIEPDTGTVFAARPPLALAAGNRLVVRVRFRSGERLRTWQPDGLIPRWPRGPGVGPRPVDARHLSRVRFGTADRCDLGSPTTTVHNDKSRLGHPSSSLFNCQRTYERLVVYTLVGRILSTPRYPWNTEAMGDISGMAWLAKALKDRRSELGLSMQKAAEELGVIRLTYRAWEFGVQRPDSERWDALAKWLGIPRPRLLLEFGVITPEEFQRLSVERPPRPTPSNAEALAMRCPSADRLRAFLHTGEGLTDKELVHIEVCRTCSQELDNADLPAPADQDASRRPTARATGRLRAKKRRKARSSAAIGAAGSDVAEVSEGQQVKVIEFGAFIDLPSPGARSGVVKWFSGEKGYVLITDENGLDVFVHFPGVKAAKLIGLSEGQAVKFKVNQDDNAVDAVDLHLVDKDDS